MTWWQVKLAGLMRASELFLRSIMENAGQEIRRMELYLAAVECDFCRKLSGRSVLARFNICGAGNSGKLLIVPCCPKCKQSVESGEEWFVNNLRLARGMIEWKIVSRNLDR